uniref:Uncharacterized protein n=1 Tax=Cacopsylla melanoneura TaxID=428564 RepID=A0A8D9AP92_9HEMI
MEMWPVTPIINTKKMCPLSNTLVSRCTDFLYPGPGFFLQEILTSSMRKVFSITGILSMNSWPIIFSQWLRCITGTYLNHYKISADGQTASLWTILSPMQT